MIRHILFVRFVPTVQPADIDVLRELFLAMPSKIDGVVDVEFGANDSPEGKNAGYTHCVLMTFRDDAGRNEYLPHPEHDALKAVFGPMIDDIIVIDFTV